MISIQNGLPDAKELHALLPQCKIALLCDENSSPEISREVMNAKWGVFNDDFFYSSAAVNYPAASLGA